MTRDEIGTHSAALAFYMAFALSPLIVLLIVSLTLLNLDLSNQLLGKINNLVGQDAAQVFSSLSSASQNRTDLRATSGAIAFFTLAISSSVIFGQLKTSIGRIFNKLDFAGPPQSFISTTKSFLTSQIMAVVMVLLFIVIIVTSLSLSLLIDYFSQENVFLYKILSIAGDLIAFTFLFSILYKILPDVHVKISQSISAALFTAIFFVFGKYLIGVYLRTVAAQSAYGAAGLPITLFVWLYYSSFIILNGAEIIVTLQETRDEKN